MLITRARMNIHEYFLGRVVAQRTSTATPRHSHSPAIFSVIGPFAIIGVTVCQRVSKKKGVQSYVRWTRPRATHMHMKQTHTPWPHRLSAFQVPIYFAPVDNVRVPLPFIMSLIHSPSYMLMCYMRTGKAVSGKRHLLPSRKT